MIPENILLNSNAYRLSPFPFYSRKFESLTIKKKNYDDIADAFMQIFGWLNS